MTAATDIADLAAIGTLLADRSRCRMLLALLGGRSLPASMLAAESGVTSATASSHLAKLTHAGLVEVQQRGRYRYYALAGRHVAEVLEQLALLAPQEQITSLRAGTRLGAMRRGRTCYDHLAGRLGVALTDSMCTNNWLTAVEDGTAVLTPRGRGALTELGLELPDTDGVRCCVDWTEQRPHLAGPHGRALLDNLLARDWICRAPKGRAVHLTEEGRRGLRVSFGCDLQDQPATGSGTNVA